MSIDRQALKTEMTGWRQELHAYPEFGFEEKRTSGLVARKLAEFGLDDVVEGVGGTGVVATLRLGNSNRSIALRADMDALRITEQGNRNYRSQHQGIMHACGHDGHTTMLLGAAKALAQEGGFNGTVRFVFQPAEEWGRGAIAMIDDGLMQRFPFDEIFGIHNMPGLPVGHLQTRRGALMSAEDNFEIILRGVGGHAANPHSGNEVLIAACALVTNLQTIVSRRLDPSDIAVISVTELITDGTRNALPGLARILGDARSFRPEVSSQIEKQMNIIAEGTALAHNVSAELIYTREFVPLLNDAALVDEAVAAARTFLDDAHVEERREPMTASEDFARFLEHVPGCFVFLGNGEDSAPLHNPNYDFNDNGLIHGVDFYTAIVRRRLSSM
ncbi:M20 aminoacylase family protein [Neorhizobium galegae]|uniref:Hippurate hydrolase n=1 Tax=Neorhizobium galegae bv. orientalis str. HAMBI 540 TaxID=1028800 RepID=A0A068T141_NEOGA|nr:M20 aminoacylase family protein [Neorhizobium galegae]MCQ1855642.1 M20 family metallopeptidase [Neorhizobium galegae]UIK08967.1 M20 family metallopeptidase [Neorhizobium galegae]CDN51766.1 Hippurate hydrolase [Neorhizobium galegae bv. orientalis str. HAMBI 540]CDZ51899.1 Hippurate hydrolase [Neorhizobium galegae bv. orientalis]